MLRQIKDPKFLYQGKLNFNPFYSNLKGVTEEINLTPLFSAYLKVSISGSIAAMTSTFDI